MKTISTLVVTMFVCTALIAQPGVKENVNYYGIDFSKTKTFGAAEAGLQFKEVFTRINSLIITEWSKYDPGKFLNKNIVARDISATTLINSNIDPANVAIMSDGYRLTKDDIADMVRLYELKESEGTGIVIIGELLEKPTVLGRFYVVYFDIVSREVLYSRQIIGKARGFGLRNYWAGAIYDALDSII